MGVVVELGTVGILLLVGFVYWLFTSKTKVKDIQKVKGFLGSFVDKIDEGSKELERKAKENTARVLKEEYKKAKELRLVENIRREKQGLGNTPIFN